MPSLSSQDDTSYEFVKHDCLKRETQVHELCLCLFHPKLAWRTRELSADDAEQKIRHS